jgi:translation initiation factor 2B subunit (eIF-2B alpha/beta/delta family)
MKKHILKWASCLLCLVTSVTMMAQKNVDQTIESIKNGQIQGPEQRCAEIDAAMKELLRNDQIAPVHEINLRYAYRSDAEIVKANLGNWSKYRRIMDMQDDKDIELKRILDTAQFEKYAAARDAAIWKAMKVLLF